MRESLLFRSSHWDSFSKFLFFISRSNLFNIFQKGPFVLSSSVYFVVCSSNRHGMFFSGGSICLSNINFPGGFIEQTCFFKEGLSVRRKDFIISTNRLQFSQKPIFSPRTHKFSRRPLCASNRYLFFRKPYLVLKHIIFQETPMPWTDRHVRKVLTGEKICYFIRIAILKNSVKDTNRMFTFLIHTIDKETCSLFCHLPN